MKNLKKYDEFLNEGLYKEANIPPPERDEKYNFLMDVCRKCNYEGTQLFYVKDLIEIGTCEKHKLYLNYLDTNQYDNKLAYWVVYNEQPDELYGTSWDSGVIWEEDDVLNFSEKHNFELFPNFIDIIYEEIKSYTDLDEWCNYIKNIGIKGRKYHRLAIQRSDIWMKNSKKEPIPNLTWEEQLDWVQNRIEHDKLLNRYSHPYDERILKEMLELGEEEYNRVDKERNDRMKIILDEILEEEKNKKP